MKSYKFILIIFIAIIPNLTFAVYTEYDELKTKIDTAQIRFDMQSAISGQAYENLKDVILIQSQEARQNAYILGLVVAIIGGTLSWWVETRRRNVEKMLENINNTKSDIEKMNNEAMSNLETMEKFGSDTMSTIKSQIESINNIVTSNLNITEGSVAKTENILKEINITKDFINDNNVKLYDRLRKQMITDKLNRLVKIPEDIDNAAYFLLSEDLDIEPHFAILKDIIQSLRDGTVKDNYRTLVLQNFPYEAFNDPDIGDFFRNNLSEDDVTAMFWNDLQKVSESVIKYVVDSGKNDLLIKFVSCIFLVDKFKSDLRIFDLLDDFKKFAPEILSLAPNRDIIPETMDKDYHEWISIEKPLQIT